MIDANAGLTGHTAQVAAANGRPAYSVAMDPNTGETFKICGANSTWRSQNQLTYLPPRGTFNDQTTWQLTAGVRGILEFLTGPTISACRRATRARTPEYVG